MGAAALGEPVAITDVLLDGEFAEVFGDCEAGADAVAACNNGIGAGPSKAKQQDARQQGSKNAAEY